VLFDLAVYGSMILFPELMPSTTACIFKNKLPIGNFLLKNDIPLLERLKERDNTENLQKNFLISDIVEMLVSLEKEKLINIWELCKYIED
jgi:hypothetical protein